MLQAIRAFDDLHQWIEQEQVMGAPGDHHFDCVDLHSVWNTLQCWSLWGTLAPHGGAFDNLELEQVLRPVSTLPRQGFPLGNLI